MRALTFVAGAIALLAAPSSCGGSSDDGRNVELSDAGQPFAYWASTSAMAGYGRDVEVALESVGYVKNRRLWDEGFDEALGALDTDEVAWIALANAALADRSSGGSILTDDQRADLRAVVDGIVADGATTEVEVVRAASVNLLATSLDHRTSEVREALSSRVTYIDGDIDCSVEAWSGERAWVVAERLAGSLGLECSADEIMAGWIATVDRLDARAESAGFEPSMLDQVKIAALVPLAYPDQFSSSDVDRAGTAVVAALEGLPADAYVWLDSYRWLNGIGPLLAEGDYPYALPFDDDVAEVLTHTISRGAVPNLEISE